MATTAIAVPVKQPWLEHRTVWRWHFYAGLFCIPFVLWLSVTGTIFLFNPQIQSWLDRPYDRLSGSGPQSPVNDQVKAALATVPGSSLVSYQLPYTPQSAPQIIVGQGMNRFRVYVQPWTLQVLKVADEDKRVGPFVQRLHGELLIGDRGSMIVELAASWAVVMIVTGLFLWWPRTSEKLAGVFYPRLTKGKRTFWRDIHAVTGVWISFFALFLLFTGLPWAKSWGGYFKAVRKVTGTAAIKQDWITSSTAEKAARAQPADSGMPSMNMGGMDMPGMDMSTMDAGEHTEHMKHMSQAAAPDAYLPIDLMVATIAPMHLPLPVLVSPPHKTGGNWTAKSDTPNRPRRVDFVLDAKSGAVVSRSDFSQKHWVDRVVNTGIAAHEGQLFGPLNQLLALLTTTGLVTLSVSGLVMWWRRKPEAVLGAPTPISTVRFSAGLVAFMIAFGVYMPFLGVSMIVVGLTERFILRRIPSTRRWLGLHTATT